jgi:pimeloyl-ACP methyl ester carboxylesterase
MEKSQIGFASFECTRKQALRGGWGVTRISRTQRPIGGRKITTADEGLSRTSTLAQVKAVRNLGSIPLIVLAGAKPPDVSPHDESEVELLLRYMDHRVHVTQAHLATLSTCGRQIVLPNVGHGIPAEAPDAIVDAVRSILNQR